MLSKQKALPYFEVVVAGELLKKNAVSVDIVQEIGSHSVALLRVQYIGVTNTQGTQGIRGSWQFISEGTPIAVNYGMKPGYLAQFLGYVASYQILKNATDKGHSNLIMSTVEYTVVGTSYNMQSTKNRTWKNTSPSAIASQIAVENGFRGVIHPYVSAIDYRLQNTSDFRFLAQLAGEIGYHFYVDNTDLYFINPKVILNQNNIRQSPTFWMFNTPGMWDTIRSFKPIVGTITPDGGIVANRFVTGLNPTTKKFITASNQPELFTSPKAQAQSATISQYFRDAPAESLYEANQKAQAYADRNLYWLTAECELRGDFRVKPNATVEMAGRALTEADMGTWLVKSVTHSLTMPAPTGAIWDATYTMCATLVRDQVYTANTSNPGPLAPTVQKVAPALIGNIWRSSNIGAQINAN